MKQLLTAIIAIISLQATASGSTHYDAILTAYMDSLTALRTQLDGSSGSQLPFASPSSSADYYRLFAPMTFYHSPAHNAFTITDEGSDEVENAIDAALMHVYLHSPQRVMNTETNLNKGGSIRKDVDTPIKAETDFSGKIDPIEEETNEEPVVVMVQKPNFWTYSAETSLQFTQNYLSDNWYKGGESNYSMLVTATLQANYNNQQKLKFENTLEMKLGFQTSKSDSVHTLKTTSDLLRYTGKLGLQATTNWYYTLQVLAYTQFMKGTKTNDASIYSDFMSPFTLNIGLGLDYTAATKNKKLTGTVNFSFLSFNFIYCDRDLLTETNGISGDHHTLEEFGSSFTAKLTWQICDNIKWATRLYYFTAYDNALLEWENTFTLSFNKYISATIFIYPRFDDTATSDGGWKYWQRQEYSSLGVSYTF